MLSFTEASEEGIPVDDLVREMFWFQTSNAPEKINIQKHLERFSVSFENNVVMNFPHGFECDTTDPDSRPKGYGTVQDGSGMPLISFYKEEGVSLEMEMYLRCGCCGLASIGNKTILPLLSEGDSIGFQLNHEDFLSDLEEALLPWQKIYPFLTGEDKKAFQLSLSSFYDGCKIAWGWGAFATAQEDALKLGASKEKAKEAGDTAEKEAVFVLPKEYTKIFGNESI